MQSGHDCELDQVGRQEEEGRGEVGSAAPRRLKGTKRQQETKMGGLYRKEQPLGWRVQGRRYGVCQLGGPVTGRD